MRIAIVGAGIGGLTLATALRQRGAKVEIFEQASELEEIGAGISLFANSLVLLEKLGVAQPLRQHAMEPSELIYRHWASGGSLGQHSLGRDNWYRNQFGAPYFTAHRKRLQSALVDGVGGIDSIRLGHRLLDIDVGSHGAELRWDNGETSRADVVVGADGIRSTVRRWMTGREDVLYSGNSGFRGTIPTAEIPSLPDPDALQFWVGPGRHVVHFPIGGGGELTTFLACVESPAVWSDLDVTRVNTDEAEVLNEFAGWHPAISEMLGGVVHRGRWALLTVAPLERWSTGPVVLLGDAAHGMLPHYGQGANQTIEDAVALCDVLLDQGGGTLAEGFEAYERLRKPRTRDVQSTTATMNALLHQDEGPDVPRTELVSDFTEQTAWMHRPEVRV